MRLIKIDGLLRGDHFYLDAIGATECYCLGEYVAGGGRESYKLSDINNLISNLKKKRGTPGRQYKEGAIREAAGYFLAVLSPEYLESTTLVPIPPSCPKDHENYDDRMTRMLRHIAAGRNFDIRELLVQKLPLQSHIGTYRPPPEEIYGNYSIDSSLLKPRPRAIALFDDVVTAGAHFSAASRLLSEHFPGIEIAGFFIARTVHLP